MKKIYFLLLCCITLASASYGQVSPSVTLYQQTWEGSENNWPRSSFSTGTVDGEDGVYWGVYDQLSNGASGGNAAVIGTVDGNNFYGLTTPSTPPINPFILRMSSANVTGYSNLNIEFDYEYSAQNSQSIPTVRYEVYGNGSVIATGIVISVGDDSDNLGAPTLESIPVSGNYNTIHLRIITDYVGTNNNYDNFVIGFDNLKITSDFDGLVYLNDDDGWLNGISPDDTTGGENALINEGTYTITSNIELANVYTNTDAGITIAPSGSLYVNGNITTASNLLLESNTTQYASLIVSGDVLGDASYSRHVNQATSDLISSPVPGEIFAEFVVANSTNLVSAGENQARFGPYDKDDGVYTNWSTLDLTNVLEAGVGYRTQSTDNGNFLFSGTVQTGTVNSEVTYLNTYASQWNLIGNPYPSYIDVNAFVSNTNNYNLFQSGKEAVYGYDGNASDGWLVYNLSSGVQMAPGQGFFVAVPSGTGLAQMQFTTNMRSIGPGDDFIAGRTTNINKTHFKLAMNTGETTRHTTEVYFNDIASLGFDKGYDATIYGNNASGYTLFTQMVESNPDFKIAIQTLPNSNLATGIDIPLGIIAPKGQQITLEIKESTLSESATVYLEDTKTNTWTLLSDKAYTFTTDEKLSGLGRFILHTTDDSKLSIEDSTKDQIQIFTGERSIKLKGQLYRNTKLAIFDIQGRQVHNTVLNQTVNEYTINTTGLGSGIYIVRIENNTGNKISKRVILK